MEHVNQDLQERKSYVPPAVVYETELEVHASSSTSTGTGGTKGIFEPLDLDK